jgi:hypothetical protein
MQYSVAAVPRRGFYRPGRPRPSPASVETHLFNPLVETTRSFPAIAGDAGVTPEGGRRPAPFVLALWLGGILILLI